MIKLIAKNKDKTKIKNKKNIPFIVITSLLGVSILIPLVLLIVSTVMNSGATKEFTKSLYPIKYESYVEKAAKEYNVDICLVYGVIRNESNFNPDIVSNAGAIGLMQIMPDTFTWLQNYRENFEPKKIPFISIKSNLKITIIYCYIFNPFFIFHSTYFHHVYLPLFHVIIILHYGNNSKSKDVQKSSTKFSNLPIDSKNCRARPPPCSQKARVLHTLAYHLSIQLYRGLVLCGKGEVRPSLVHSLNNLVSLDQLSQK